jgi:hypothetical protein
MIHASQADTFPRTPPSRCTLDLLPTRHLKVPEKLLKLLTRLVQNILGSPWWTGQRLKAAARADRKIIKS